MKLPYITALRRERARLVKEVTRVRALLEQNAAGHYTSADVLYITGKIARIDAQIVDIEAQVSR